MQTRRKLLLADENAIVQRVIELTFASEDIEVLYAGNGDEAMARIPIERPDIVLADVGLAKRSGYDVAMFVKSQPALAHIPVLLLVGAFEPVDEERARQAGSDGVLVKPFDPQHVIARVRELIDRGESGGAVTVEVSRHSESPDDYFDRLDAAFAQLSQRRAAGAESREPLRIAAAAPAIEMPLQDAAIGVVPHVPPVAPPSIEPPDTTATLAPAPASTGGGDDDAGSEKAADELANEVTRRVLQRFSGDLLTEVVTRVVSEVTERLVRQEVARMRENNEGSKDE